MYPVNLRGEKVALREFRPDDLDAVNAIVGDERVATWLSFDTRTREQASAILDGILDSVRD